MMYTYLGLIQIPTSFGRGLQDSGGIVYNPKKYFQKIKKTVIKSKNQYRAVQSRSESTVNNQ